MVSPNPGDNDGPLSRGPSRIKERHFAGAKGDSGQSFIVAFRSAKERLFSFPHGASPGRGSKNAISPERKATLGNRSLSPFAPRKSTVFFPTWSVAG